MNNVPNLDFLIIQALRISLEEQRVRQQGGGDAHPQAEEQAMDQHHAEENAMDVGGDEGGSSPSKKKTPMTALNSQSVDVSDKPQVPPINFEEMTEEEQMAYALRMSVEHG